MGRQLPAGVMCVAMRHGMAVQACPKIVFDFLSLSQDQFNLPVRIHRGFAGEVLWVDWEWDKGLRVGQSVGSGSSPLVVSQWD